MDWYDVRIRKIRRAISKRMPKWLKSGGKKKGAQKM
jgi:hypothetical protein